MNEKSYVRTLLSKKIFWVILGCFLITALIVGVVIRQKMYLKEKHLREKYIESQPRDMMIKIGPSGVFIFHIEEKFFSVNTEFHHRTEIDESMYEEAKTRINDGLEEKNWEKVLEENNIEFSQDEEVVFINDFIYYAYGSGEDEPEFFRFNTITKSTEKIDYDKDVSFISYYDDIELIEAAVFSVYPNIINEIEYVISQNPKQSRFEYLNMFVVNGHIVFQGYGQIEGPDTSVFHKLYEYLPEQEEAVFLIDTGDDEVEEVIFLE